ncbi:MAG: hypothetical protein HY687_00940 [Chloroflexi bacterium]|nr:hypothetical protein [Chloroflexota bacterium]
MKLRLLLGLLLALGLALGCAAPAPTPTLVPPAPTPSPTATPALTATPAPASTATPVRLTPSPTPTPRPTPTPTPVNDKVIRLYYYGPASIGGDPAALPGAHSIFSATSSDGLSFREEPGVRFSYDTRSAFGITDPDVVRLDDGSWLMFLSLGTNLLKAVAPTSTGDFTLDEFFRWSGGGVSGSYNFGGTVRTFVPSQGGIRRATYDQSKGALSYTGVALLAPPSGFLADPSVIQVEGQYLMFYKYAASPSAPPTEHEIYLATSSDGVVWSQHRENRFVGRGSVPGAVYYNGTIYVYYNGLSPRPDFPPPDLGVAVSRDGGATFTFSAITIQGKKAAGAVDPAAVVVGP